MPPITWNDLLFPGRATDFFTRRTFSPFEVATEGHSDSNALWLAELSRLVYRRGVSEKRWWLPLPRPSRESFLSRAGLRERCFFESRKTDTQALLVEAENSHFAVLVFRGTEQRPKDFIIDINVGLQPLLSNGIGVHAGFRDALDSVWNKIKPELDKLTCPIFFTGHSLGAALATLAATLHAPQAVYAFGSPLVGNEAFVTSLKNVPIYRVIHDQDPVTIVPPAALGFRHAGEAHILTASEIAVAPGFTAWLRNLGNPSKPLADHAPVNYVDRIGMRTPV